MTEKRLTTPVAFIIFNRPDTTEKVFEQIRTAKPTKLYLISDAPREDREEDKEKVAKTRAYVEEHVDWDCRVYKNYAESNMGCGRRVSTGISWVFENEEEAIILEDDVVPMPEFFTYCSEMLEKYRENKRVMMVSGTNLIKTNKAETSYTFSCYSSIWGWATWRRAWEKYDFDVKDWPEIKKAGTFRKVQSGLAYLFLTRNMESVYTKAKDTWDIQWDFCRYQNKGLGIVPAANMISNIGFNREDATHTTEEAREDFSYGKVSFPLVHPSEIKRDTEYDKAYIKKYFGVRKVMQFVKKKLHR